MTTHSWQRQDASDWLAGAARATALCPLLIPPKSRRFRAPPHPGAAARHADAKILPSPPSRPRYLVSPQVSSSSPTSLTSRSVGQPREPFHRPHLRQTLLRRDTHDKPHKLCEATPVLDHPHWDQPAAGSEICPGNPSIPRCTLAQPQRTNLHRACLAPASPHCVYGTCLISLDLLPRRPHLTRKLF